METWKHFFHPSESDDLTTTGEAPIPTTRSSFSSFYLQCNTLSSMIATWSTSGFSRAIDMGNQYNLKIKKENLISISGILSFLPFPSTFFQASARAFTFSFSFNLSAFTKGHKILGRSNSVIIDHSTLYCWVHSSKSFWFISMNSFSAL